MTSRVRTERKNDRFAASIAGLGAEIGGDSEKDAIEGKVATELAAFQSRRKLGASTTRPLPYLGYFGRHASRFYLNCDEVRGLASNTWMRDRGGNVPLLRNGQFVPLPQPPGAVSLEIIATQFGDITFNR